MEGEIRISGSKNACLAIMAGSVLCDKKITLIDVPDIKDIFSMSNLINELGGKISIDGTQFDKYDVNTPIIEIDNSKISNYTADYESVKKMRASIFVLGPLLTRFHKAKVSLPGGCVIGARGIDLHIEGLKKMGAKINIEDGYIIAEAKDGLKGCEVQFPVDKLPSVGATENLMSAGVLAKGRTILKHCAKEPEVVALANFFNSIGAKISGQGTDTIIIDGVKQEDLTEATFRIPADRIEAGTYAIAVASTDGNVLLTNCDISIFDNIKDTFEKIGIGIEEQKNGVRVFKSHNFIPYNIETQVYPSFPTDLQAQITIPLMLADGTSTIKENIFENRFMHLPELARMGSKFEVNGNEAKIYGNTNFKGANVMATDLRASASLLIAGLVADGITIIDRVYHLDRGYDKIENKLNNCGANIKRIR